MVDIEKVLHQKVIAHISDLLFGHPCVISHWLSGCKGEYRMVTFLHSKFENVIT
jgi:hypothetical protein